VTLMIKSKGVSEMSLFEGFNTIRLVKVGPSLWERLEEKIGRRWVVTRLVAFRQRLAQDMEPEPWTVLEAPAPTLLADLCTALGLSDAERGEVLGLLGLAVLEAPQPLAMRKPEVGGTKTTLNERQLKALAHAEANGGIDARTFRRLCPHWSSETLRVDLARLVRLGLLKKVGRKKGTRYVVPKRGGDAIETCAA